jgi:tripartite-type tricarboxylate transporter receptor subunit TctC
MMHRRTVLPFAAASILAPHLAWAQGFPKPGKPVRIIVGFAAGGPTDTQARALAQEMAKVLNTTVIVENKPGASGGIGAMEVARAEPDGQTLMYISDGVVTQNPHTLKSVQYDPFRDFTPIAQLTAGGVVLVVHPSVPSGTLQEFIAYGKAHPGQLAYASFGTGTVSHIYGEVLRLNTGMDIVHVPYKGSADALKDLLTGRVQLMFAVDRGPIREGRPAQDSRQRWRKAA